MRTAGYLERQDYRGWDPFDALSSPLFRLPALRSARLPRFAVQQVVRRLPINVRPLLGIPKGRNPVTVALAMQAHAHLHRADVANAGWHRSRVEACITELARMRSPGWSGDCWGYDFDWEARYVRIPAWTPTLVATGMVTNALHAAWRLLGADEAIAMCESATGFVLNDLPRTANSEGSFCWAYSPLHADSVLNATMMGARLCAQVYAVTGQSRLAEAAAGSVAFVVAHQSPSGAWPYAIGDARRWADNFHTAYVLDCLEACERLTRQKSHADARERGWHYYRSRFFTDDGAPKYYDYKVYPLDATACAQSIVTLSRFGDRAQAVRVARWANARLARPDGSFSYQLRRWLTVRIPYARWSTASMLLALAVLADEEEAP